MSNPTLKEEFEFLQKVIPISANEYQTRFEHIPKAVNFKPNRIGDWEIMQKEQPPFSMAYFVEFLAHPSDKVLFNHKTGTVWMSMTPMELVSMTPFVNAAKGDVAVLGLGMGCVAANLLLVDAVDTLKVYELDADVISLFLSSLEGYSHQFVHDAIDSGRLEIIHCDAYTVKPETEFDYVYVDTWEHLGWSEALTYVDKAATNFKSKHFMWWGMEIDLAGYITKYKDESPTTIIRKIEGSIGFPTHLRTLEPDFLEWYFDACIKAVMNTK